KKTKRTRPFEEKESYKWVEAIKNIPDILQKTSSIKLPKIIHIFDREGDIAEVFEEVQNLEKAGLLVRATHNRVIGDEPNYLWDYMRKQAVQFCFELEISPHETRKIHDWSF
ncbi:MAG: 5-methyltetrahydropteroyltriglutamate--homocysteine methyltransferase, partial [Crocosphaera sp.]